MVVTGNTTVLIAALLALGGCVILPIPTPEWGDAPFTDEQLEALEEGTGERHRDQVIAELGEPSKRYADDRVLIYEWSMKQGIWIYGVANAGGADVGESQHRICLLFDPSGILVEVRHIDSATSGAETKVRAVLDDWVGSIAGDSGASGYTRLLDIDAPDRRNAAYPAVDAGILIVDGNGGSSECHPTLDKLTATGYPVYGRPELRDKLYPWLEDPWTSQLDEIASNPLLEDVRQDTGLRFIVVADIVSQFPVDEFCSPGSAYGIGCYEVELGWNKKFVAVLDLKKDQHGLHRDDSNGARITFIPIFPMNERGACEVLITYALDDIGKQLRK